MEGVSKYFQIFFEKTLKFGKSMTLSKDNRYSGLGNLALVQT
jgi:hypothetical protein